MLIDKSKPFYSVVQVAEILGISADRLRTYDEQNLICPSRRLKDNKRLYSEIDIEWLKGIRDLISKNRMNIYSFKLIWKMMQYMPNKSFQNFVSENCNDEVITLLQKLKNNPNFSKSNTKSKI